MAEAERRQRLRERYSHRSKRSVMGTPPPIKGRRHEIIQTDHLLEELFVKPNEYSVECQTDLYLYTPPNELHVPAVCCVDVGTASDDSPIISDDDSVYGADIESILDVLVELAMKQAIYEFLHEEEIADQQLKTKHMLKRRITVKRLDSNQTDRRSGRCTSPADRPAGEDINATALLQWYLSALLPDISASLYDMDIHQPNNAKALEPWLANEIAMEIGGMIDSRESLMKLIKDIVATRAALDAPTNE